MRYICLVYLVEKEMDAMTKTQADTCTEESLAYDAALRKAGHLIAAHALQPVAAATTIRVRNGKLSTTDGPFAETKEQLGGFLLIEARDLNEALHPTSSSTTVRVREGKALTTDGPFAETKEQLGGYYIVNCKDLDEAIQIAADIPGAAAGAIEVRPVMEFD